MKKIIFAVFILCATPILKAEDAKVWFNMGSLKLLIPLNVVNVGYLWDFKGKQSLVGAETPFAGFKGIELSVGALTSIQGQGTPYVGMNVSVNNPVPDTFKFLSKVKPGIFGGRDFNSGEWIFGIKAAMSIFE